MVHIVFYVFFSFGSDHFCFGSLQNDISALHNLFHATSVSVTSHQLASVLAKFKRLFLFLSNFCFVYLVGIRCAYLEHIRNRYDLDFFVRTIDIGRQCHHVSSLGNAAPLLSFPGILVTYVPPFLVRTLIGSCCRKAYWEKSSDIQDFACVRGLSSVWGQRRGRTPRRCSSGPLLTGSRSQHIFFVSV